MNTLLMLYFTCEQMGDTKCRLKMRSLSERFNVGHCKRVLRSAKYSMLYGANVCQLCIIKVHNKLRVH